MPDHVCVFFVCVSGMDGLVQKMREKTRLDHTGYESLVKCKSIAVWAHAFTVGPPPDA